VTYQSADKILYEGKTLRCYDEWLLRPYWKRYQFPHTPFAVMYTSCWRGYEATWRIDGDAFWLIGLNSRLRSDDAYAKLRSNPRRAAAIDSLHLCSTEQPVLADWIDGSLTAYSGEMVDWGWSPPPKFEFTHEIEIRAGRVIAFDTYDEIEMCARENRNAVFPMLVEDAE
jgi:hypothetical protein